RAATWRTGSSTGARPPTSRSSIRAGSPRAAPGRPSAGRTPSDPPPVKIDAVDVFVADIPVTRPHAMSFTTLRAVNFVFVRLRTDDGLAGWGEAACLGGPTWSEESAESVAATIERYV